MSTSAAVCPALAATVPRRHEACLSVRMRLNFKRLGLLGAHPARALAREVDLTSARFDLMTLLLQHARIQREIAAILCVAESVVSRMVTALEEAGLVRRTTPERNRRVRYVSLTDTGRAKIELFANDEELLLPSDGRESMQCLGEVAWMAHWIQILERLGLDQLMPIICTQPDVPTPPPPDPPFWAMQLHVRAGCYRTETWHYDLSADDPGALPCVARRASRRAPSWAHRTMV